MNRRKFFAASAAGMAAAALSGLLAACGAPQPNPTTVPPPGNPNNAPASFYDDGRYKLVSRMPAQHPDYDWYTDIWQTPVGNITIAWPAAATLEEEVRYVHWHAQWVYDYELTPTLANTIAV